MSEPHLILCGDAKLTSRQAVWRGARPTRLTIGKKASHVHLSIDMLSRRMKADPPDVAVDLLEVASYIYSADQATPRGSDREFEYGLKWRRHFRCEIPVRRPDLWQAPNVVDALKAALGFLTDDDYEFSFCKNKSPRSLPTYLGFGAAEPEERDDDIAAVLLFSGGLDSLGGAVQEVLKGRRKVALVSHRPVSKVYAFQKRVLDCIRRDLSNSRLAPLHVAVEVNKGKSMTHDFSQRSRSFLFASLAAIVARLCGIEEVRFFENGIVGLNLPTTAAVIGGRASRTTHPVVLQLFRRFFSALFECDFQVRNPFEWRTKAEILGEIKAAGFAQICAESVSCMHTIEMTNKQPHCGRCSQCIDRRLAALWAGLTEKEDDPAGYRKDVLTGPRDDTKERTLVERIVGSALQIEACGNLKSFLDLYGGEISRVLKCIPGSPDQVAGHLFELHVRHAKQVLTVLGDAIKHHSAELIRKTFPATCLLSIAVGRVPSSGPPDEQTLQDDAKRSAATEERPVADRRRFAVCYKGKECPLGNSKEFAVFEYLAAHLGEQVHANELRSHIWGESVCRRNTIARAVSNLRRSLRTCGILGVAIKGIRDHYMLHVVTEQSAEV